MPTPKPNKPILTLRATVLLLCALLIAAAAGALTYLSARQVPTAVIVGGSAFAAALMWLNKIVA